MLNIKKIEDSQTSHIVYDVSLDGTFVNALGMNVLHNTDGFNFKLPDTFRYTDEHPYIGKGLNKVAKEGKAYTGYEADIVEYNEKFFNKSFSPHGYQMMALEIDEVVNSTINFSRKNYADFFPDNPFPKDVKLVGNSIKSKKMPEYIAKFLAVGIRHLLRGDGQAFLEEYYNYIEKIYNYKIPLRDIATKGKIKKSIAQYLKDVKEITKAGRPKSRQAWYELAIAENIPVGNGDTIYYINTGTSKSHADVKKVTHYYIDETSTERREITKEIEKKYKDFNKEQKKLPEYKRKTKEEWIKMEYPYSYSEEEIIMNCKLVPRWIIDSDDDKFCSDVEDGSLEYNTPKYISMFNSRITPLLVCFSREIRDRILITHPSERNYFTKEECALVSGQPNNPGDQDTYEQLMTMEDKEIRFWMRNNMIPPFLEECGMGSWEDIVKDYEERMEREKELGIDKEKAALEEIISNLGAGDIALFMNEGTVPSQILKISNLDPITFKLMSKNYPNIEIGSLNDIVDASEKLGED